MARRPISGIGSLDGQRINRRAGPSRYDEGRATKEEVKYAISGAVCREFRYIKHLAHGESHRRDYYPVPRLLCVGCLIGSDLDAPSVGADCGDFFLLRPKAVLELHSRRVTARVAAPITFVAAALHLASSDDDEVPSANAHTLRRRSCVKLGIGNSISVRKPIHLLEAGNIQQDATANHL